MARWKLMCPHYRNTVEPQEWEYSEIDSVSGKMTRKRYIVPRYLDPQNPSDWTSRDHGGEIVVCLEGKGQPGDIEITGDPTPHMIPLDAEAAAISATFEERWRYKPDESTDFNQSLVSRIEVDAQPAKVEGLEELVTAMKKQTEAINKAVVDRRL